MEPESEEEVNVINADLQQKEIASSNGESDDVGRSRIRLLRRQNSENRNGFTFYISYFIIFNSSYIITIFDNNLRAFLILFKTFFDSKFYVKFYDLFCFLSFKIFLVWHG